jgi:hypothetical protein
MSNMTEPPQPHMSPFSTQPGPVNEALLYGFLFTVLLVLVCMLGWFVWNRRKETKEEP